MLAAMAHVDFALAYDPNRRCADVVFNGTDFALDTTPGSAMLMSVLARRRANPDDTLPVPVADWANPDSFNPRGGWPGDALDPTGQLVGSRLWLLERADNSERTRVDTENYVAEAVDWLNTVRGLAVAVAARWVDQAAGILGYRVRAGATVLQLKAMT